MPDGLICETTTASVVILITILGTELLFEFLKLK